MHNPVSDAIRIKDSYSHKTSFITHSNATLRGMSDLHNIDKCGLIVTRDLLTGEMNFEISKVGEHWTEIIIANDKKELLETSIFETTERDYFSEGDVLDSVNAVQITSNQLEHLKFGTSPILTVAWGSALEDEVFIGDDFDGMFKMFLSDTSDKSDKKIDFYFDQSIYQEKIINYGYSITNQSFLDFYFGISASMADQYYNHNHVKNFFSSNHTYIKPVELDQWSSNEKILEIYSSNDEENIPYDYFDNISVSKLASTSSSTLSLETMYVKNQDGTTFNGIPKVGEIVITDRTRYDYSKRQTVVDNTSGDAKRGEIIPHHFAGDHVRELTLQLTPYSEKINLRWLQNIYKPILSDSDGQFGLSIFGDSTKELNEYGTITFSDIELIEEIKDIDSTTWNYIYEKIQK